MEKDQEKHGSRNGLKAGNLKPNEVIKHCETFISRENSKEKREQPIIRGRGLVVDPNDKKRIIAETSLQPNLKKSRGSLEKLRISRLGSKDVL